MPNWCINSLKVTGSLEDLTRFKEAIRSEEEQFDFNRIIPMPEDLNIEAGSDVGYQVLYGDGDPNRFLTYEWVKQKNIQTVEQLREYFTNNPERKKLADLYKANIEKYGYPNWYDWCCANWGTKWSADTITIRCEEEDSFVIIFDTAWSPPMPIFEKLAAMFPTLTFDGYYVEHGTGFCGTFHGSSGSFSEQEGDYGLAYNSLKHEIDSDRGAYF
jgi:hypothetical protein